MADSTNSGAEIRVHLQKKLGNPSCMMLIYALGSSAHSWPRSRLSLPMIL